MSCVNFSSSISFGPGTPISLMLMLMKPDIFDVRRDVGAGTGKAHPGPVGPRLRVDAVPQLGRQAVVDDELAAHDAVRLRVAAALEAAGLPEQPHLLVEARDDRVEIGLFVRDRLFLGDRQSFVRALPVDQRRRQPGDRIAKHGVEQPGARTDRTGCSSVHQEGRQIAQPVQERRAGIGWRRRSAGSSNSRLHRLSSRPQNVFRNSIRARLSSSGQHRCRTDARGSR